MQASDRDQFEILLEKLYAGFNMPMSRARSDAYFDGLQKMQLSRFARCVETALGEDGPERIPSVTQIWGIFRKLKLAAEPKPVVEAPPDPDHLAYLANRLLWLHVSHRGGLGSTGRFVPAHGMVECVASDELNRCLTFKREVVAQFAECMRSGDKLSLIDFTRWWLAGLRKVSAVLPRTITMIEAMSQMPDAMRPLPPFMARELKSA